MPGLRMILFSMVLYSIGLLAALIVTSPYWLFRMAWSGRYRDGLMQRLGAVPRTVRQFAGQRRSIWVHAVSVGEMMAAAPLVELLSTVRPGSAVVVSTTTRTGHALAQERFRGNPSVEVVYYPLDFAWSVRRYLRCLQPAVLVLMESELWPRMLTEADRSCVPVIVVNGRVSDRSLPRYRALRWLWRPFLRKLTMVLAQSEQDRERWIAIGVSQDRVRTAGNLKFDVRPPAELEIVGQLRANLPQNATILVAGSTLEGEEELLLATYRQLAAQLPDLCLILAPRHPQRFDRVAQWIANGGLNCIRRSDWASRPEPIPAGAVFLLDSIGELSSVYALATVAFVGGSLVPAGGHNPLEPAQFAIPIVMGPYIQNFRGIAAELLAQDAMRITPPEKLADTLHALLSDPQVNGMGLRAKTVFDTNAGASRRAAAAVMQLIDAAPVRGGGKMIRSQTSKPLWRILRPLLLPFALVYAMAVRCKNAAYDFQVLKPRRLSWPVVVVGNLSVGGTGKTPMVLLLADLLARRGWYVDVLSRGYGRVEDRARRVEAGVASTSQEFGDEPLMLARRGIPVFVAADRYQAGLLAEAQAETETGTESARKTIHLLDDGFQHRKLARTVNILLLRAADLQDDVLPMGRLREPLYALERADICVLRAEEANIRDRVLQLMRQTDPARVWLVERQTTLTGVPAGVQRSGAVAFCGIADSEGFFQGLRMAGANLQEQMQFSDHHQYTSQDVERLKTLAEKSGATCFITTEKDAARLSKDLRAALQACCPLLIAGLELKLREEARSVAILETLLRRPHTGKIQPGRSGVR